MPAVTTEAVVARVGTEGFSAYVAEAVSRQLQRDALGDILAQMDTQHGPADEAEVAAIMERLRSS